MKLENKIFLFLTLIIIYLSMLYVFTQKQETEIELDVSNSLINDLILNQKYTDGTYASGWHWEEKYDKNYNIIERNYKYSEISCDNISVNLFCSQHILISNQSLNGTTYVKIKASINIIDILIAITKER